MTIAQIMMFDRDIDNLTEKFRSVTDVSALARQLLSVGAYRAFTPIETHKTGVSAAEDMFDLTNEPALKFLRRKKLGNHPIKIVAGDIVAVDGELYLFTLWDWVKL